MCGICGVWLRDGEVDPATLIAMRDTMAHRGPDGASGVLVSSVVEAPAPFLEQPPALDPSTRYDVGLGHRRLAIIDLAGGSQPMASRDRRTWLVFNGEIYNFRELRTDLEAAGHEFITQSDTEVLLRAYEAYGVECVSRLNGIFAFAVWDGDLQRLFVARDHFGVKPLYYAQTPAGFVFGSELKALLASGLVAPALDLDALGLALTFRFTPAPATLLRGVRKLEPGRAWSSIDPARSDHGSSTPRSHAPRLGVDQSGPDNSRAKSIAPLHARWSATFRSGCR